jgi:single-strand DNA-binding protein
MQGNLGAAPELNTSPSGISSASFRIAVKRNYKESDGSYKTDWFSCVAFRHKLSSSAIISAKVI